MNAFTIKDLENLSGIKAHTIRIWEQRYKFLNPKRTATNIRYYSNAELQTILNIALLNKYGYKISLINHMTPLEMKEKILTITQVQAQEERRVNDLIFCMVDMQIDSFELQLDEHIAARGIEYTIVQLLFPLLERIGILWQTNHINPAQEHLITHIIRQKLMVGIEATPKINNPKATLLLFLPEGEHHDLGLLFANYLLNKGGVKVIYLGSNVPLQDVEFVANLKNPDILYTHITSLANNFNFKKFIETAHQRMPDRLFFISGFVTQTYLEKLPENVHFKRSLSELMDYIGSVSA